MSRQTEKILIIDDEPSMRHMLRLVLEKAGYQVSEAGDGISGLQALEASDHVMALCDIRMPGLDGLQLIREINSRRLNTLMVMMSAYGTIDTAVECMKLGAFDFVSKPFKPDEVLLTLSKAREHLRLQDENRSLKGALARGRGEFSIADIVYTSELMGRLLEDVGKVAASDSAVLVSGETGTGKELVARALHSESPRRTGPFLAVNCSTIAAGLLESELFGHVRGAFTGADRNKEGLFSAASGGTLFLDEIAELPLDLQPKLLRVLQEGEVRPVGANQPHAVDTRVIAASGMDLQEAIKVQRFRSDLFYRLAVVELKLPPLRERREDIPTLARHFLAEMAARDGRVVPHLDAAVADELKRYSWPGNVRELRNFIEKALIFSRGDELDLPALPGDERRYPRTVDGDYSLKKATRRLEEEYLRKALRKSKGNRTQAAKLLEISLRALMYKIKEYDLEDVE